MKRTAVIIMFVIVAVLSAAAIFIGLRLRESQSTLPDYIFADGNNCCNEPDYQTCAAGDDPAWQNGYNQCQSGGCAACAGGGPECGNGQCESGETATNCTADCPSGSSSGGGAECNDCGGSGEACCAPENCGGTICNDNLACDSGSGTCTSTGACLDGSSPGNNCMIYTCPNGCSDFGGGALECRQNGTAGSCNTNLSGCGQIDLLNTAGGFCQVVANTCSNTGCGPTGSSSSSSSSGDTCGNGTVNSGEQCDPDATPNGCSSGATCLTNCTCAVETTDSSITKTANQSCNPDGTTSTITYTIVASNNGSVSITIDIVDALDPDVTQYIDETSITGGGIFNEAGDEIAWADQEITAGANMTVTYNAVVPRTIFGTVLTNTVEMLEGTTVLDSAEASITPNCELPETALISDSVDRILIGVLLVLVGVFALRFDLLNGAYNLFIKAGGKYFVANFDEGQRKNVTDEKAKRLEKRIFKGRK